MTRGQAAVETAVGLLVFVTVLLGAIAFGELGFLSMKVHEAATGALWDTTARPMHRHADDYAPRARAIELAGPRAVDAMGPREVVQVFVKSKDLEVQCRADGLLRTHGARHEVFPGGEGGMQCRAHAELSWVRLPKDLFERPLTLPLCGLGRPRDGACTRASYALLLDTWALTGDDESRTCKLRGCNGSAYRDRVEQLYERYEGQAGPKSAQKLAREVVGAVPGDDSRAFRFSFVDSAGDPSYRARDADPQSWMTNVRSGSRNVRYYDRGPRFLGRSGPF
ncbi:MAG: pilus assembly protein [Archangiaceae bacterium]|nr:pilus assembly protein [Archangiaceae bacterium]